MQSILVNCKITKDKILPISFLTEKENLNEFIIYADNILEGITLLNDLTLDEDYLKFYGVIYEPIDQPIYIFHDYIDRFYAIKICGSYDKWDLPKQVAKIINYIDLPDYIIYSLQTNNVIMAGENTETASVGNSQWQREGRKLGAAKIKVPFVYQTFYSGRDESQDSIREPSSLQVYNHLVYSVRYKTPSFVCYFENNFENSATRNRTENNGQKLLCDYIKTIILSNVDKTKVGDKKCVEFKLYKHMLSYIKEKKFTDINKVKAKSRIYKDLPSLKNSLYNDLLVNDDSFIAGLIDFLYETDEEKINRYIDESLLLDFDKLRFEDWTSYNTKPNISTLIAFLHGNRFFPKSYIKGSSKVGFVDINLCRNFLSNKFVDKKQDIKNILDETKYSDILLMPLRIHKKSNGALTFSPDPESGEIVAFSELFSLDLKGNKIRPVVGYCIVDTPRGFSIHEKIGTKLYKALAEYVDILIFNNNEIITNLEYSETYNEYFPVAITETKPKSTTEEMAIVSTYLNQSTINSDWELCFIHTHHSSWQQLVIHKGANAIQQKIDRVSTKVDLIMQQQNLFMIAEGKNDYQDIIRDGKIQRAMLLASEKINELYKEQNQQFDAFVYNLNTVPEKNPEFYVNREKETIKMAIDLGHFSNIAHQNSFVVIIVYLDRRGKTAFKLVYAPKFNEKIKERLDKEFNQ
ncbi:MAG: hypothetical protein IJ329_02640 [Clostridia bacterium]|nr:hypothetical protein [Clostridia bacterium]